MRSARSLGLTVGVLLFLQLAGLIVPFILIHPIATPEYLSQASDAAFRIRVAVMLFFVNAGMTLYISILAFQVIRESSVSSAVVLVAASVVWFVMQAIDNSYILSMLSLSQQYSAASGATPELLETLGTVLRSTRRWVHYVVLLVVDAWFFLFYWALFRWRLVPRALGALGLAMTIVHAAAVPLPEFLAYRSMPLLAPSLLLSHLAIGVWLIARGLPNGRAGRAG